MIVHHLSCATLRPVAGRLVNDERRMLCHCLLLELGDGLALVDTGYGLDDLAAPGRRLGTAYAWLTGLCSDANDAALRQVERLGFRARDVRHILCTHLDPDHAGGLPDFPEARVHVFATERDAALARSTLRERERYRRHHLAHGPRWSAVELSTGERWHGFDSVRPLEGLPPEVLMIPLVGHSRGHAGVAVDTGSGWLLHAGDAYFHHGEMATAPFCSAGLRLFQRVIAADDDARRANRDRLRDLALGSAVRVFCSHDPHEFADLAQAS